MGATIGLPDRVRRHCWTSRQWHPACLPIVPAAGPRWQRLLLATFVAALALAVLGAVGMYWKDPLGDWDAWAIWNQRARFFFRAGDQWQQAFAPIFYHPDYPLLVPSSNARLWSYLGAEATWAPWLLGVLFTFATLGVLTAGLWRLRSRSQGLLAGMVLLGMVPFLQRGAWQYADVPLAFYILAAVLLLLLYDAAERPQAALLVLSGLMAGLAAWTEERRVVAADRPAGGASRRLLAAVPATGISGTPLLDRRHITGSGDGCRSETVPHRRQ